MSLSSDGYCNNLMQDHLCWSSEQKIKFEYNSNGIGLICYIFNHACLKDIDKAYTKNVLG